VSISWSDKYKTGIDSIDEDHQTIFNLVNALSDVVNNEPSGFLISITLLELSKYVSYHFACEEELFKEVEYPESAEHIAGHREIESKLHTFSQQFHTNPQSLNHDEFILFLEDWLTVHIMETDFGYIPYIKKHDTL